MRILNWYVKLALLLIAFSVMTYLTQIYIFEKPGLTFFYILQDLSFVPIEVLIVTLILDRLLKRREKQGLLNKLNMVIGVFFHEVGNDLIKYFCRFTIDFKEIEKNFKLSVKWIETDFKNKIDNFTISSHQIEFDVEKMESLKEFICGKRSEMLNMLENPNLLEHESFTDLLWAVFHLMDELYHRDSLQEQPKNDQDHLKGDLVRAYKLLVFEWLSYMKHLKKDYPYLYSIAIRTNPFNSEASIIVQ